MVATLPEKGGHGGLPLLGVVAMLVIERSECRSLDEAARTENGCYRMRCGGEIRGVGGGRGMPRIPPVRVVRPMGGRAAGFIRATGYSGLS
jgi:hypothetical protein